MFTGIVKGKGTVENVEELSGLLRIRVVLPENLELGLETGASVAVDGVCLTVTELRGRCCSFDVMQESLARTTLHNVKVGTVVNIERAAKDGAEIGGHPISGHVDCTAKVVQIHTPDNNRVLTFMIPKEWMRYIFPKGYIALNGTSLTVSGVNKSAGIFEVWFIPETLRLTTFGEKRIGDLINLEIERGTQVAVDTMRDFLEERLGKVLPVLEEILLKAGTSVEQLAGPEAPALPSPRSA
jgi:riboflavin synthase